MFKIGRLTMFQENRFIKYLFVLVVALLMLSAFLIKEIMFPMQDIDPIEDNRGVLINWNADRLIAGSVKNFKIKKIVMYDKPDISEYQEHIPQQGIEAHHPSNNEKVVAAIIVTDLGLMRQQLDEVIKLPRSITLAFVPYAKDISKIISEVRGAGFEALLNIPLQTKQYPLDNPGPYALFRDDSEDIKLGKLKVLSSIVSDVNGFYLGADEVLTSDTENISMLYNYFRGISKNVVFSNQNTIADVKKLYREIGLEPLIVNLYLDETIDDTESVLDGLKRLSSIAKVNRGFVIGCVHAYPQSLEALKTWLDDPSRDIEVVTINELQKRLSEDIG